MAYQTVVNNGAASPSSNRSTGLMENVGSFGNDLATLASLQGKLAAADAKASLQKAAPAIAGLVVAALLAFSGAVVLLVGFALWIAEALALTPYKALMLTGLGALIAVAVLAAVCVRLLGSSFTAFRRSSEEFERNLAWIKTTLTHSGR